MLTNKRAPPSEYCPTMTPPSPGFLPYWLPPVMIPS